MKPIAYLVAIALQIAGLTALATDVPGEKLALVAAGPGAQVYCRGRPVADPEQECEG